MPTIRVVAAVASKTGATLVLQDGSQKNLLTKDWQTRKILEDIAPKIDRRGYADINLDEYSIYATVAQQSKGRLRLLKDRFINLLGLGPKPKPEPEVEKTEDPYLLETPVTEAPKAEEPAFQPKPITQETVVLEVDGEQISGVEAMEAYFEHAAETKDSEGLTNFLSRMAKISKQRKHTADELLNFMKRGDLPLADDGSIVAYKVLVSAKEKGVFVDKHTKRVRQKVGSRVSMPEAKVDPSRRKECSTGLHIARRGYLRGFHGDIITLVKIAPEDVIAVPHNDPDKMRVAAYHICGELPPNVHETLRQNKPMTQFPEAMKLLTNVIRGKHIGVLEEVRVGIDGERLVETVKVAEPEQAPKPAEAEPEKKTAPVSVVSSDKEVPRELDLDKIREAKSAPILTKAQKAKELYQNWISDRSETTLKALLDFKKQSKKGWPALGMEPAQIEEIQKASA